MPYKNRFAGEELTVENAHKAFRYDEDSGALFRIMSGGDYKKVGTVKEDGRGHSPHLIVTFNRRSYPTTHIIWMLKFGRFPAGEIDHKNLDGCDDKFDNLREASHRDNTANRAVTKRSQSGVKGVVWDSARGKWAAYIGYNYKRINLGRYNTKIEAQEAYEAASKDLNGEFHRC